MSVYMALALVVEASSGETRQEILDAFGLSYDEVSTFTKELYSFRNRKYAYKNSYGNDVVSAYEMLSNSIWLDEGLVYNQTGVNNLVSNYYCSIYEASFENGTAKKMINQYVEYKTNGVLKGDLQFSRNTDFAIIHEAPLAQSRPTRKCL